MWSKLERAWILRLPSKSTLIAEDLDVELSGMLVAVPLTGRVRVVEDQVNALLGCGGFGTCS